MIPFDDVIMRTSRPSNARQGDKLYYTSVTVSGNSR